MHRRAKSENYCVNEVELLRTEKQELAKKGNTTPSTTIREAGTQRESNLFVLAEHRTITTYWMGARRHTKKVTVTPGDCSSVSTDETHESSPFTPIHENRPRRQSLMTMIDRLPSERRTELLLPDLDHDVDLVKPQKISIWTSKFMTTMYIFTAVAFALRNHRLLYAIPLYVLYEALQVILKWKNFVADDPQLKVARSHISGHMRIVTKEANKSKEGGYIRRRQEAFVAGMSGTSLTYAHEFLARQSDAIRRRVMDERRRTMVSYGIGGGTGGIEPK